MSEIIFRILQKYLGSLSEPVAGATADVDAWAPCTAFHGSSDDRQLQKWSTLHGESKCGPHALPLSLYTRRSTKIDRKWRIRILIRSPPIQVRFRRFWCLNYSTHHDLQFPSVNFYKQRLKIEEYRFLPWPDFPKPITFSTGVGSRNKLYGEVGLVEYYNLDTWIAWIGHRMRENGRKPFWVLQWIYSENLSIKLSVNHLTYLDS